jgi:hypothetical protein
MEDKNIVTVEHPDSNEAENESPAVELPVHEQADRIARSEIDYETNGTDSIIPTSFHGEEEAEEDNIKV